VGSAAGGRGAAGVVGTWGRLLRVPNLFTVPGDPVAGYVLAAGALGWHAAGAVGASLCLYAAGLLLNDYFDREVDARERPERPVPSGAVRPGVVLGVGLALLGCGVGVAWLAAGREAALVAGLVAIAVVAYDGGLKRLRWLGPVAMGSCRAGSVLIGAAAAGGLAAPAGLLVAGITWAYTTAVSVLAAGETSGRRPGRGAFAPALIVLVGACAMLPLFRLDWTVRFTAVVPALFALAWMGRDALAVQDGRLAVPPFIGRLIVTMVPLQLGWSVWCLAAGSLGTAACLWAGGVGLTLGALGTARRFYGS